MPHEAKLLDALVRNGGQIANILPRKFWWILLALLSVFLMAFVLTALPPMFVINHAQKQCALMDGDDFSRYGPPESWQEAIPDAMGQIQNQFGSCNLKKVHNSELSYEECCQKIGYTYVGMLDRSVTNRNPVSVNIYWGAILVIIIVMILAIYYNVSNKKETFGDENNVPRN